MTEPLGFASTPYTQRVKIGAIYTDGADYFAITDVHCLGTVSLENEALDEGRTLGIDAFRRRYWLVKEAPRDAS